jgi:hypothetical protein
MILIKLPKEVDREEEMPQYRIVEASVYLGLVSAKDDLVIIRV